MYRAAVGLTGGLLGIGAGALLLGGTALPAAADPLCLEVLGIELCLGDEDPPAPVEEPTSPPPVVAEPSPEPTAVESSPPPVASAQPPAAPIAAAVPGELVTSGSSSVGETPQSAAGTPAATAAATPPPSPTPRPSTIAAPGAAAERDIPPAAAIMQSSVTGPLAIGGATLLLVGSVAVAVLMVPRLRTTKPAARSE